MKFYCSTFKGWIYHIQLMREGFKEWHQITLKNMWSWPFDPCLAMSKPLRSKINSLIHETKLIKLNLLPKVDYHLLFLIYIFFINNPIKRAKQCKLIPLIKHEISLKPYNLIFVPKPKLKLKLKPNTPIPFCHDL